VWMNLTSAESCGPSYQSHAAPAGPSEPDLVSSIGQTPWRVPDAGVVGADVETTDSGNEEAVRSLGDPAPIQDCHRTVVERRVSDIDTTQLLAFVKFPYGKRIRMIGRYQRGGGLASVCRSIRDYRVMAIFFRDPNTCINEDEAVVVTAILQPPSLLTAGADSVAVPALFDAIVIGRPSPRTLCAR
jgi:hypothetical protein